MLFQVSRIRIIIFSLLFSFTEFPALHFKTLFRTDWEATTHPRVPPSSTASFRQRGDSISLWVGSAPRPPWDTVSPSFLPTTCEAVGSSTISVTSLGIRPRRQGSTLCPPHLSFTTTELNNDLVTESEQEDSD